MQDLTLVGLSEDKTMLVLVSDSGEEFRLPADARLRAALRGDHARLGQLEIQMESALRPRDIQARIRSGATPEAVAQAAQTTVDKIMSYAMPVLAERAHVADRAQRASVRRKTGEGPARALGDAVAERLRSRNVDPTTVEWDAWRREDGRWTLVADYRSGEQRHHAQFSYDAPGRYVVAEDEEARWLVGEQSARKGPQPRTGQGASGGSSSRRLSAVSAEEELPLGADAIDLVTEDPTDEPTVDLTATREHVTSRASDRPSVAPEAPTGDADWIATQASERPRRLRQPGVAEPEPAPAAHDEEPEQPAAEAPEEPAAKKTRKGRRAVPSWDEIMFGGGRGD